MPWKRRQDSKVKYAEISQMAATDKEEGEGNTNKRRTARRVVVTISERQWNALYDDGVSAGR